MAHKLIPIFGDPYGNIAFLYFIVFPLICVFILTTIIYICLNIFPKTSPDKIIPKRGLKFFGKIFLIILMTGLFGVFIFIAIPAMTQDRLWESKQAKCADEAGYDRFQNPANIANDAAIGAQQRQYHECLS